MALHDGGGFLSLLRFLQFPVTITGYQSGHSNPQNVNTALPTQRENPKPVMSGNSSRSSNSKIMVPEARAAMDKFKMEAADEVGVTLNKGCNGSLTSREAGFIGGRMVKKCPERTLQYIRTDRTAEGHEVSVRYIGTIMK